MDRNIPKPGKVKSVLPSLSARRAWIEILGFSLLCRILLSLSARRAWIEITAISGVATSGVVALRKESVDRNFCRCGNFFDWRVALRKESVDRNIGRSITQLRAGGRSPQGERG